jgi:thioredoxin-like negative regulator of GroEL
LARWKTAIKLAPERPELALGLARALRECGQSAEAGTVLDDAYQRLPDHPALVLALAEVCCDQHRLDKAELLRKRLPREAEAASLYLTGLIQQREGMTLEAASTLIEAVKKRTLPPDIEAKALLALCEIYRMAHAARRPSLGRPPCTPTG